MNHNIRTVDALVRAIDEDDAALAAAKVTPIARAHARFAYETSQPFPRAEADSLAIFLTKAADEVRV